MNFVEYNGKKPQLSNHKINGEIVKNMCRVAIEVFIIINQIVFFWYDCYRRW